MNESAEPTNRGEGPAPTHRPRGRHATVQAFCYNRNAAQSDELHRRFWVGSIAELLLKVVAQGARHGEGDGDTR